MTFNDPYPEFQVMLFLTMNISVTVPYDIQT